MAYDPYVKPDPFVLKTNSLTSGIVFCVPFIEGTGNPVEITKTISGAIGGTPTWDTGGGPEPVADFPGGAGNYWSFGDHDDWTQPSGMTLLAVCTVDYGTFLNKYVGGDNNEWSIGWYNGNDQLYAICSDESAGGSVARSSNAMTINQSWCVIVMTYDGGTTDASVELYKDGTQVDTTNRGSGTFVAMENGDCPVCVGRNDGFLGAGYEGKLSLVAMWSRVLSGSEIAEVTSDPFTIAESASGFKDGTGLNRGLRRGMFKHLGGLTA